MSLMFCHDADGSIPSGATLRGLKARAERAEAELERIHAENKRLSNESPTPEQRAESILRTHCLPPPTLTAATLRVLSRAIAAQIREAVAIQRAKDAMLRDADARLRDAQGPL